ncbi:MAG: DotU family type IV/VI secretion system protein [Gemmatirosa sp.]|nr:DotU family type IV/VI secretion system protein [Gemmatirosa sp.]
MTSPAPATLSPAAVVPVGAGRLALAFQEALTAIVRLRADRQPITDPAAFRAQMLQLLGRAEQEARGAGYDPADIRLAVFAVVALLDESALNARQPALAADWARRPLQEELFGGHMAGEWFFQHVEQLLARPDTPTLVDLLEVHDLVVLLGFRGRYGAADPGALHAVASRLGERVARLRGAPGDLSPTWRPPNDAVVGRDPWIRRLVVGLAAALLLAVALWGAAAGSLRGASADLRALASTAVR